MEDVFQTLDSTRGSTMVSEREETGRGVVLLPQLAAWRQFPGPIVGKENPTRVLRSL